MAPERSSSKPLRGSRTSTPESDMSKHPELSASPATPSSATMGNNGDIVMGATGVLVPPSPGFLDVLSDPAQSPAVAPTVSSRKTNINTRSVSNERSGAGVRKTQPKHKTSAQKLLDAFSFAAGSLSRKKAQEIFRFMDLPGEIRNIIYHQTFDKPKQALLVHRPRMASLRPRTRLDRQRTLDSDIRDRELSHELSAKTSCRGDKTKGNDKTALARETNRPFWGLTQVCRQLRTEFRPIYLQKQEIGMDLTEIVQYLQTFYSDASTEFAKLNHGRQRGKDMPFTGNLTIAVSDKPLELEKSPNGVEVIPLLDLWANSFKIEAGFGRYLQANYVPQTDGEAKDLYRLFGRRVLRNRQCSSMNNMWRTILRTRALASVMLHRKPASRTVDIATLMSGLPPRPLFRNHIPRLSTVTLETKPFIHILFRSECAEAWMTQLVSDVPKTPVDWLATRGFGEMEYFDVKVGVAPRGLDRRA